MISEEIQAYYARTRESERLSNEWGELERLRTESILLRYLPPAPATIVDVGGAAGVYAIPLAKRGYGVHLIDPVERHLDQARRAATEANVALGSVGKGDARYLDLPPNSADSVLLLGPLYHLPEYSDRIQALREGRRILKPGGILVAAAISRFASLIDGLSRGFFRDARFRGIIAADLKSGRHTNSTGELDYFTTAYFHRPEELSTEAREAGFQNPKLLSVEGPVWSTAHFLDIWKDVGLREDLLEFLSSIESEPSILGASAHILVVAQ
jgi:ubiquinone/menaquinone biosynthesis C-methylase UbiE